MSNSCKSCRTKKIKCDLQTPCGNCTKSGRHCEPTTSDLRRKNYSSTYVKSLEYRVAKLERILKKVKDSPLEDHYPILDSLNLNDLVNTNETTSTNNGPENPVAIDQSHLSVYGPLSIYHDKIINPLRTLHSEPLNDFTETVKLRKNLDICEKISSFFKWQYTDHFLFIHRDSFLTEFFNLRNENNKGMQSMYCSEDLVYSIVALSSKISNMQQAVLESSKYYDKAKKIIFDKLSVPTITTIQSLLCLAFYDLGEGNNSSAWLLSGIAFRMGIDIGFQLNPQNWHINNKQILLDHDVEIRKRIYWGCYTADHFISLLLGRPCQLRLSISTIPQSNDLPMPKDIEKFEFYDSSFTYKVALSLKKTVNLLSLSSHYFFKIFIDKQSIKINELLEYNHEAMKWRRELPENLSWNQNNLKSDKYNPCIMGLRYTYYILLLCFNRPFILSHKGNSENSPMIICYEVINDLYIMILKFLRDFNAREKTSLLITYASIMSISVILSSLKDSPNEELEIKLELFMKVLNLGNWQLARRSFEVISLSINSNQNDTNVIDHETWDISNLNSNSNSIGDNEGFFGNFNIPTLESFVSFNEDLFNVNSTSDFIDLFS